MWWIAAGAQLASGFIGGRQAKKAANRQARREAQVYYKTAQENIRRLERNQELNAGMIKAGIGASGLAMSGTQSKYLMDVELEQAKQLSWENRAAEMNRDAILAGGKSAGSAAYNASVLQGFNAALGTASSYYGARSQYIGVGGANAGSNAGLNVGGTI